MKPILSLGMILFTPLMFFTPSQAEIYKWTDADGNVFYGDKPQSSKSQKIKVKKSPAKDSAYQKRVEKRQKLLNVMQEEREDKIAKKQKDAEKKAKQKEQCIRLKAELKEMRTASFLYEETDDPFNPKVLSDKNRAEEEQKYQKYIDKNC